ncbi:flocculation protein FLO11 isoform X2 [Ceratitis capitata]|uniref:flocculation protein FLO11 isoform X2 n=1 Tax=Ceratitis capitata TaxID=7213 RepID=UPI00032A16BD|nr:flocculation protein FLO11 isoform X2 [Ceratitis capitata]
MNNSINQSNIRLCRAVEQHPCLYDRSHASYDKLDAFERAWRDIATACGELVPTCKLRWRNIRTAFTRLVVASPKKRKGNRTRDYHLQEALQFYVPHIQTGIDETSLLESDDETDSVKSRKSTTSTTKQNKAQKDEENEDNAEVVDESALKTNSELLKQQLIKRENTKSCNKDNLGESKDNIANVLKATEDKHNVGETKGGPKDNVEGAKRVQKDEDTKRVQQDKVVDTKKVQKSHVEDTKSDKEEVVSEVSKEQINKNIKNEENMLETIKRMPGRPRRGRKTNEDIQLEDNTGKSVESRPTRKTQSMSKNDINEDSDDAANSLAERPEKTKSSNKISYSAKGKGTFYITPKNSGTKFVIKKNNDSNDNNKTADASENDMEEDVSIRELALVNKSKHNKTNEIDNVDASSDDMPLVSQSRFRRASKRSLDKPTPAQLRVRQKESKTKELKHSTERLKTLGKAAAQLVESPKKQPKPETSVEPNENPATGINSKTRILCRAVVVDPSVISLSDTTTQDVHTKTPPTTAEQPKVSTNECQPQCSPKSKRKLELQNVETTTLARIHQGVQCSLQPTSSDDEFLKTLKPYLHDMNARQKLHFKKKIFESLMEVFDSGSDFPTHDMSHVPNAAAVASATAIIPKQLSSVRDEELRLVRELVAMVQAAKHTTDIQYELAAEVTDTSQQMHMVSSFEKQAPLFTPTTTITSFSSTAAIAPPTLAVRGTPLSTSTPQNTKLRNPTLPNVVTVNNRSIQPQPVSTAATGTITINSSTALSMSPGVQRRVVRKLVKVNADGQVTYSTMPATATSTTEATPNGEVLRRRIYRILPKPSMSNEQGLQHAVTTSGVGTFIVPRTTDVTANIETPRIRVGNNAPPGLTTTASSTTNKQDKNKSSSITVAAGARPLMRRYSVCGALPNAAIERQTTNTNKFITTTANTREAQTVPKITIASRNSPPKMFAKDIFKLPPTSTRSINTSIVTTANANATVTVVVTNTTNSRSTPIVSVSNSSARTVPLTVGFNKFFRGDINTKGTPTSQPNSVAQNSNASPSQVSNSQGIQTSQPRISISSSTPRVSYAHYSNKSQSRVTVSQNPNTSRASNSQNSSTTHSQCPVMQSSSILRGASSSASDNSSPSSPPPPPAFVACNPVKRTYERSSATNAEKRLCSDVEKRNTEEPIEEDMLGLGIIASDAFDVLHIKEEPEDLDFEF